MQLAREVGRAESLPVFLFRCPPSQVGTARIELSVRSFVNIHKTGALGKPSHVLRPWMSSIRPAQFSGSSNSKSTFNWVTRLSIAFLVTEKVSCPFFAVILLLRKVTFNKSPRHLLAFWVHQIAFYWPLCTARCMSQRLPLCPWYGPCPLPPPPPPPSPHTQAK